ncbi:MAG: alanine racemase [Bacteriovoracaceae bacterium]|nr:alanine racemase [Bacteriovoracaceae bacterium]
MEPARLGSHLVVHLDRLKKNIDDLRTHYPENDILFMVKADGYGHGLTEIVKFAFNDLGILEFGVATLGEAISLRRHLSELTFQIYVFSDLQFLQPELAELYLEYRLIPVISHEDDLELLLKNSDYSNLPLCLKFNTGMNRLGLSIERSTEIIEKIKSAGRSEVFHLMSHFANASMPMETNKRNIWQRERFNELKNEFQKAEILLEKTSLGNSGALEQDFCKEETHIRPGLMLFGPSSMAPQHREKSWWKGRVLSELKTKVLNVFDVSKGDPLGYGSTPAPDSGTIAIIALGYGDGVSTRYMGATLYHKGVAGRICARVCMDMTFILFPKGTDIKRGEEFCVWDGDPEKFSELALETKTLPYELVIQLTARVPRIYQID